MKDFFTSNVAIVLIGAILCFIVKVFIDEETARWGLLRNDLPKLNIDEPKIGKSNISKSKRSKYIIGKPPGTNLLALVDFLFSPKTVEQTFRPIVSDWRYEYYEALKQGHKYKARWISMRYRYSFIMAMSLSKIFSFLKQLRSLSK